MSSPIDTSREPTGQFAVDDRFGFAGQPRARLLGLLAAYRRIAANAGPTELPPAYLAAVLTGLTAATAATGGEEAAA